MLISLIITTYEFNIVASISLICIMVVIYSFVYDSISRNKDISEELEDEEEGFPKE